MSKELAKAIAVCAELTGTELSQAAARVFSDDLSKYPEQQVMGALSRCRRELKGRLTLADVISRLDDGRPGVEEAWAMIPKTENESVVWTEEMALAMADAGNLLDYGDEVGARMTFKEKYLSLCRKAREECLPVSWSPSLGYNKYGREPVLIEAYRAGRLSAPQVRIFLPEFDEQPLLSDVNIEIKQLASAVMGVKP